MVAQDNTVNPGHIISLNAVRLVLDGKTVIDDVSLEIKEHRVGIIGFNGSGKSTLARLMTGLISPSSGMVMLDDINPCKERQKAIRKVGMVFQNPDHQIIFPTVLEEMTFGLTNLGMDKHESRTHSLVLLARFGLEELHDRPVHNLSQGQRHLVCLLAVLAMNPNVLILDEPFTGPDTPTVKRLFRLLSCITQAVILITHDTHMLEGYDRVIWLNEGRIYRDGPAADVLKEFNREVERIGALDTVPDRDHLDQQVGY